MILSIASGKGGTGKTTLAVNIAAALDNAQLIDCDVEAPDTNIFLNPQINKRESVYTVIPKIDSKKCNFCGLCAEVCAYGAINIFGSDTANGATLILDNLCHGCGACMLLCPQGAISEEKKEIGEIESGSAQNIQYANAKLKIGDVKTAALIKVLKKQTAQGKTVIADCPPGTSCPMVAAVSGSDFCLLVTEPSPFGLNDLDLAVQTVRELGIKHGVFINRAEESSTIIQDYCAKNNVPLIGHLDFDMEIAKIYSEGKLLCEADAKYKQFFIDIVNKCKALAEDKKAAELK